jgi:uncharacterized protein (TIGR03790 family)
MVIWVVVSRLYAAGITCIAYSLFAGVMLSPAQTIPLNERVLVVYDTNSSGSREVANYYMAKRGIPEGNSCRIRVSSAEYIDRDEFESQVKKPIRKCLESVGKDKILYVVFSYQTPFGLRLEGKAYSLDQFVADIWDEYLPFRAASQNEVQPYLGYAQSEGNAYQPFVSLSAYREKPGVPHIYSVWRMDAATPALSKGLVDKALFAEVHGLSGKACFDLTVPAAAVPDYRYGAGNWDIYQAEHFARAAGFPILEDTHSEEFGTAPAPLRCDDAALYAGWYSLNHYNDAFSWKPGAIGIHLDSASADNPRRGANWAANALLKGITVTSGAVSEPFLENLPHPDQALLSLFEGATAGDALLRSTRLLKWMIINIGDPLYRPFPKGALGPTSQAGDVILALLPQVTLGDTGSSAIIGITAPAPEGGLNFAIKSDRPDLVEVPHTVSVPGGTDHASFAIQTRTVQEDATTVKISVAAHELARSNTLVVFPLLAPLTVSPDKIRGGTSMSGSIVLHRKAPAQGIRVALSSNDTTLLTLPREIKVPEGQNTATFTIATHVVSSESSPVITASYGGVARKKTVTILP